MEATFAQKPEAIKFSKGLKNIRSKNTLSRWVVTECKQCSKSVLSTTARYRRAKYIFCCIECKQQHIYDNRSKKTDCKYCGKKLKVGEGYRSSDSKSKSFICDKCRMIEMAKSLRNNIKKLEAKRRFVCRLNHVYSNPTLIRCSLCDRGLSVSRFIKGKVVCVKCKLRALHQRPEYIINNRMKNNIRKAIGEQKAGRKWEKIVGYTLSELKNRLEGLFHGGMTWENIGEWHIDHIIPKSNFKYESENDLGFKKAWALDNLQPLWGKDNLIKHTAMPGDDTFIRLEDWLDSSGNISPLFLSSLECES